MDGWIVVRTLEAAMQSMRNGGAMTPIRVDTQAKVRTAAVPLISGQRSPSGSPSGLKATTAATR